MYLSEVLRLGNVSYSSTDQDETSLDSFLGDPSGDLKRDRMSKGTIFFSKLSKFQHIGDFPVWKKNFCSSKYSDCAKITLLTLVKKATNARGLSNRKSLTCVLA